MNWPLFQRPANYSGANFGKSEPTATPAQQYLREKAALMAAEKYYAPEEFEELTANLSNGLITVRIFDDGIVIDRKVF